MAEIIQKLPPDIKRTIMFRQLAFLLGVAASVALGVYVVLWSQTPNYTLLYGSLSDQDASAVLEVLQKSGIEYKVEQASGAVMVPSTKVHDARMKLAAENLPQNANMGFGMLQEEQKLGTSQFIERARYQHALEAELARTIENVSGVRSARVHLATPKQSSFLRDRTEATASVMLDIYSGHTLEDEKVAAIASLVAASVPHLEPSQVSIVDQYGRLMTQSNTDAGMMLSNTQFQYSRRVEESYVKRIEDILTPIVGPDGVKAQVSVEMDFTSIEQTRESYNPDLPALRSEQIEEESQSGGQANGGVPGALSNQPPADATAPEVADGAGIQDSGTSVAESNMQRRATRNYELDRTISHTTMPVGSLRRLSIAVLLDHKQVLDSSSNITYVEHSPEEIEQIISLVKEAIGYSSIRGDTVNVMNAAFTRPLPIEALPEVPFWQQAWLWDIAKQVLGVAIVLFLIFGILKPAMSSLMKKEINLHESLAALPGAQGELSAPSETEALSIEQLRAKGDYDSNLTAAKTVVNSDPKLTAQVVKNWVGDE